MAAMGALCLRVGLNSKPPHSNPPKLDKLDTFGQLRAVKEARKSVDDCTAKYNKIGAKLLIWKKAYVHYANDVTAAISARSRLGWEGTLVADVRNLKRLARKVGKKMEIEYHKFNQIHEVSWKDKE